MKHRYTKICAVSAIALTQAASFSAVQAQSADADDVSFEEIIVTAQKREQRLIEVPMAVTAIGGAELEQRGIDSIQDLSFAVPGLTMREDGPGSYQVFLRGVANAHGGGALVSVYQDESPMNLTGYDVLPTRTLDLARIEVLKGPQGTLYGQGSVAGAVRYITNDPSFDGFTAHLGADISSVKTGDIGTEFTAVFNMPIIDDKLALRVAATVKGGGGWQDQPEAGLENANDEKLTNLRVKALWKPTDELEVLATFVSYHAEYELGQGYEQPDRTVYVALDPSRELIPKIWDYELYNLKITLDLGFAELLSSSSYADMEHQYPFAYFGGPETIYGGGYSGNDDRFNPGNQFTQEVRLSSLDDGPLQWTVGGFYRDMERSLTAIYSYDYFGYEALDQYYYSENGSKAFAVFANASYKITDRLELGAGIRYFEDKATEDGQSDTFDTVNPRFFLSYELTENANVYASVSKGFRTGGFNLGGLPSYSPESLWSYELGVKGSLLDGRLYVDAAVYYTEYKDMLSRGLQFIEGLGLQSITSNIGEAEIKGIEAGLTWKATDALTFNFNGTIIDAEITKLTATGGTHLAGEPIDYVPDFSMTVGAEYSFTWSDNVPGFFRADYSYRDEMSYIDHTSFPDENLPQYSDSIGLVNVVVGASFDKFNLELYAQNLTDENKYIDPYHGWNNANRTKPRTVGVKVGVDF